MDRTERNQRRLEEAQGYGEVWEIVKGNAQQFLKQKRRGMMLFLDDMPLKLGAYHPVGTNNIVLNRALVQLVEATTKSKKLVNAFVYTILLHEYLHALGYLRETEVRPLVFRISKFCFGEEHVATRLAKLGPWSLFQGLPVDTSKAPNRVMEIVRDFEKTNQRYIV